MGDSSVIYLTLSPPTIYTLSKKPRARRLQDLLTTIFWPCRHRSPLFQPFCEPLRLARGREGRTRIAQVAQRSRPGDCFANVSSRVDGFLLRIGVLCSNILLESNCRLLDRCAKTAPGMSCRRPERRPPAGSCVRGINTVLAPRLSPPLRTRLEPNSPPISLSRDPPSSDKPSCLG